MYAPEEDPEMKIEHYDRSWQQNEEMGLNDMKVEGYEAEAAGASNDAAKHREDAKPNSAEAQHLVEWTIGVTLNVCSCTISCFVFYFLKGTLCVY